jgi:uncharacterized protein (TIGR03437 family)
LATATTLANNASNSQAQIISLVTSIEQAYAAFVPEVGRFTSAIDIDSGLRAALYFSRAAAALAVAEGPSSLSVQNRLQIAASQLTQVRNLMQPVAGPPPTIDSAHASINASASPTIGLADTRSSASLANVLAPGSVGAILGDPNQSPLAMQTSFAEKSSTNALPYELSGVSVVVGGRAALLLSVSPSRITFIVPEGLPSGEAEVIVTLQEGYVSRGTTSIFPIAPGIFTASGTGSGSGLALNAATYRQGSFDVVTPDNLGTDKQTRLMIFATGFSRSVANVNTANDIKVEGGVRANLAEAVAVEARLSNGSVIQLAVEFAGTQGQGLGIDQINVILPASLKGAGTVELTLIAGCQRSNGATISIK